VRGNISGRLAAFPGRHRDASLPNNLPSELSSFVGREIIPSFAAGGSLWQAEEGRSVMTFTHILLGIIVISTGLFTGLLMTVLFFFERALRDLSGTEFTLVMQRFLKITRTHPLNYAMVLTSGFLPIALLVMLRERPGSSSFVLMAAGLLAFWCGPILTSRFVAQPVYGVFMSWKSDAPPQDWRDARDRYFRANVVRGLGSAVALVCFVVAAIMVPL
jgi:uncharacterized membrane protein